MEIDNINLLTDRIEITYKNGKLWDSEPNIQFDDEKLKIIITFLDQKYYMNFKNEKYYLYTKNYCNFYF